MFLLNSNIYERASSDGLISHRNQFQDFIEEDLGGKGAESYAADKTEAEDSVAMTVDEESNR